MPHLPAAAGSALVRSCCLSAVLALSTGSVPAAEIIFEHSAVDKLLSQTLFKDNGRHALSKGACGAFLESPSTQLTKGRVRLKARVTSKIGVPAGDRCMGMTITSWTVVSGRPVSQGSHIQLDDILIEEVEDPRLRLLLNTGLGPAMPKALQLDVAKAVSSMLKTASPDLVSQLDDLHISTVEAEDDKLAVKFDFTLKAR